LSFQKHTSVQDDDNETRSLNAEIVFLGEPISIEGQGNGPIDAFVNALCAHLNVDFRVIDYHQHTTGMGADAQSACYIEIQVGKGATRYGAALNTNIVSASLMAVCSAFNRAVKDNYLEPRIGKN